jgi:hypothetical protein
MLSGIGKSHQIQHFNAVLGDLLAQGTFDGARHLHLGSDREVKQAHAGAVDREFGVQCHGGGAQFKRIEGLINQGIRRTQTAEPSKLLRKRFWSP